MESSLRLYGKLNGSIVDGLGFRYVIFTQGCPHSCKGCHNPQSHDFDGGTQYQIKDIIEEIKKNPMLAGLTLSGGEPLAQSLALLPLVKAVRVLGLDIWVYTGYTYEYLSALSEDDHITEILKLSQVLVDGPFILEQKSLELSFRGSSNQRIIDLEQSRKTGRLCLLDLDE